LPPPQKVVKVVSITPVSILKHLFFRAPVNNWQPAMAKTKRKNISTRIESLRSGSALIREDTITLSPATLDIVRRGLITLKDLNALRLTPLPYKNMLIYPLAIMTKSKIFQASLKYAPLFNKKPNETILTIISIVYKY
jgi:hypothetical protein